MYEPIANTTFSYVLTLDEFRSSFAEATRPSWVKITTITMVSSLGQPVDVHKLRQMFTELGPFKLVRDGGKGKFEWSLKPTSFYNQITLTYVDEYSTKSVKVFPNGAVQVAGCSDLFDCNRIIKQLQCIFKKCLNVEATSSDFRVVMINSNFSLNYSVNLMLVAKHFEDYPDVFRVSFEPDRYSAVKIKFAPAEDMKVITVSIFSTGKIIITGAETLKEIAYAYKIINTHIDRCPEIRHAPSPEKDVFDTFMGHKCDTLVKNLREKGFQSWVHTIHNRKINFLPL